MRLTRRKAIIGLGAFAAGGGAIAGTGALPSGQPPSGVKISFAGDSEAFLSLTAAPGVEDITFIKDSGDVAAIQIKSVNLDARTVFEDAVAFTNRGERPIREISASFEDQSVNAKMKIITDSLSDVRVAVGETVVGLGFIIDTIGYSGDPDPMGILTLGIKTEYQEGDQ